ncbi:MAG: hypothetical protein HYU64_14440 [Armatimonadetes bacterium]|nr:hypothetical protein [Armatimonadota bacterium]
MIYSTETFPTMTHLLYGALNVAGKKSEETPNSDQFIRSGKENSGAGNAKSQESLMWARKKFWDKENPNLGKAVAPGEVSPILSKERQKEVKDPLACYPWLDSRFTYHSSERQKEIKDLLAYYPAGVVEREGGDLVPVKDCYDVSTSGSSNGPVPRPQAVCNLGLTLTRGESFRLYFLEQEVPAGHSVRWVRDKVDPNILPAGDKRFFGSGGLDPTLHAFTFVYTGEETKIPAPVSFVKLSQGCFGPARISGTTTVFVESPGQDKGSN